ncbi:MAG TPA: metallophosphoesterase [bacterium]|nr:metallophosphoesterase [bacterium]
MKKLKLIISDLHLSAGAHMADGSRNLLEDFFDDDILIEFIEHHGGPVYADHQVELVVNGDFFNLLLDVEDGPHERITEEVAVRQMRRIIEGHAAVFDALKAFCAQAKNRLILIVGNHDAALLFPRVQEEIHRRLDKPIRFEQAYVIDDIFVTHGHQYEFIHSFDMNNFTRRDNDGVPMLKLPWGSLFIIQFLNPMKLHRHYIDKVMPFRYYLRWAFWNDNRFFWRLAGGIFRFWMGNRLSRDRYRRREFRLSPQRIANAMNHKPLFKTASDILSKTRYRSVVFSHSHKIDYRKVGEHGEYYNTGSWSNIVSLDVANLGKSHLRPYIQIRYENETPHMSLQNWIGSYKLHREIIP